VAAGIDELRKPRRAVVGLLLRRDAPVVAIHDVLLQRNDLGSVVAVRAHFPFVALPATTSALLLPLAVAVKQQPGCPNPADDVTPFSSRQR